MMKPWLRNLIGLALLARAPHVMGYPLDGYEESGIRRVEAARLAVLGEIRGRHQPPGARLPLRYVDLRLLDRSDLELPQPDPEFTAEVAKLLGDQQSRYGMAILDLSDPEHPRYAEHRGDHRQNVGSVGKLAVALAVFQALADTYPDDREERKRILRDSVITADRFIESDHHEVRIWKPDSRKMSHRPLQIGDRGTLWEFLDWMLSASSNAAASTVMKQAMLLVRYGKRYPISESEADRFFAETPKKALGELFVRTFHGPIARNGLELERFRQGSFFTRYGKRVVPGTTSYGTARELTKYMLRMEGGRLVDAFSSRELKRLLYMTERRIRYAASPALADSAVYFKSGSLYSCKPEPGFVCKKYHGNERNYMNSVAIIESPAGGNRLHYIVTLISNVLYKNSAVDHQTLATRVHRLLEADYPQRPPPPGTLPAELTFGAKLIGYGEAQKQRTFVGEIQVLLQQLGFEVGEIDGILGRRTESAIKRYQLEHGLKADGKPSERLLAHLRQAANPQKAD